MRLFILGLTGGIGMGKSAVARMFSRYGVPVFDADQAAHAVTLPGGAAVPALQALVPDCFTGNILNRGVLAARMFQDTALKTHIESIIHPLVQQAEAAFLAAAQKKGRRLVVLDIPLLYETGAETRVNAVAVVTAPTSVQRARVMRRPGMTRQKLAAILAAQLPDGDKRARADFIIPTGGRLHDTLSVVKALIWTLKYARNYS